MRNNKYHSIKTTIDGITFDSKKEAEYYKTLKHQEQAGLIHNLELQKKFLLIPKQYDKTGKVAERACYYKADFCYYDEKGNYHVVDVKGYILPSYVLKRKLMLWKHGIKIEEV